MKILATVFLVTLLLGLLGARYQDAYDQVQDARIANLEFAVFTPTAEVFPTLQPTFTYNIVQMVNQNSVGVRIRECPATSCPVIGTVAAGLPVDLCFLIPVVQANGYTWMRKVNGGWLAVDFLTLTDRKTLGDGCQ